MSVESVGMERNLKKTGKKKRLMCLLVTQYRKIKIFDKDTNNKDKKMTSLFPPFTRIALRHFLLLFYTTSPQQLEDANLARAVKIIFFYTIKRCRQKFCVSDGSSEEEGLAFRTFSPSSFQSLFSLRINQLTSD